MLLVGGADALSGLQTITIVAALPFVLVMVGLAVALVKDLRKDPLMVRRQYGEEAVAQAVIAGVTEHGDDFAFSVECANGTSTNGTSPNGTGPNGTGASHALFHTTTTLGPCATRTAGVLVWWPDGPAHALLVSRAAISRRRTASP